jgi:pyruvate dehydrogenase E2 component (dihydrolipoamide acetyltransferase)
MIPVTLPQLSISMEEGKVVRWLVEDGQAVSAGQPLVEIETDKATMEVEAPADGQVRILASEGDVLAVEATIAEILAEAEEPAPPMPAPTEEAAATAPVAAQAPPVRTTVGREPQAASPAARRVAAERGIDLAQLRGSGPGGRIMVKDLPAAPAPAAPSRSLRDAVVANITASWQQLPHIHIGGELDGTGLAEARRTAALPSGEKVIVTDLLIMAVARALHDVPELNGTLDKRADRVHLALAVAMADGVVAPVIRNADELSLAEVVRERTRIVAAARAGASDPHDLAGGTFTLTNLGPYPVDFFAPIVSGPQVAMLATGRLAERPVAVDGMLAVRDRLWANVAVDHRAADGETGARFLAALERRLTELPTLV